MNLYQCLIPVILGAMATGQPSRPREGTLQVGDMAPNFSIAVVSNVPKHDKIVLHADGRSTVKLSDLKGKPVVLIFGSCT